MYSCFDLAVQGTVILVVAVFMFSLIFGLFQWKYDRRTSEVRRRWKARKARKLVEIIITAAIVVIFFALLITAAVEFDAEVEEGWDPRDHDFGAVILMGYCLVAGLFGLLCLKLFGLTSQWSRDIAEESRDIDVEAAARRRASRRQVPNYVIEENTEGCQDGNKELKLGW